MNKKIKTTLLLMSISLLSIACGNMKSTQLVGTYRSESGKSTLTVTTEGQFGFNSSDNSVEGAEEALTTRYIYQDMGSININGYSSDLTSWDLTDNTDKHNYEFKDKIEIEKNSSSSFTTNYADVTRKLEFKKDGDKIVCNVTISGVDNSKGMVGSDGSVKYTK